jgi:pimeloyl-ACP methyl ester carboxylesterase
MIFALAHWSGGGAWAWGEVPDRLRAAGCEVVAPDFDWSPGVTPMDHAAALVAAVGEGADAVAVCGHSYGGLVALPAAEALGARAVAVVVLDGLVPDDGDTGFALRWQTAALRRADAAGRGDGRFAVPAPQAPWGSRLVPIPVSAFEAPVRLSGAVDALPRTFLWCLEGDMGEQAQRAGARGWQVVRLEGADHSLPLDDPQRCADALLAAGCGDSARSVRARA